VTPWILEHFLNPGLFWPGVALVAVPIIIHLINRLRYRRVRFAAMEFLLASEQRNRRRILLEQLLLLLLRVLIVLLLALLIARLILDPSQISLFQGAQTHHLILLDDSGSMRDRVGEEPAFDRAKGIVRRMVSEGAQRPGSQRLSLLLLSQPDSTFANLGERTIDAPLLEEVTVKLEALECRHQRFELAAGLDAARRRLAEDRASVRFVHVLTDVRRQDWVESGVLGQAITELDRAGVKVNFVRIVPESHENLAITELTGAVEVAAAGIPIELSVAVRNFGQRDAAQVRLSLTADGERVPRNLLFEAIAPGETVQQRFEVTFSEPGRHRVEVALEADLLEADNVRFLAIDVPAENEVLIVEGQAAEAQGRYVADALAADRTVTGYAPTLVNVEGLRRADLTRFQAVHLINVAELPPDGVTALEQFVAGGGGLVWFLGDSVQPKFYTEQLYEQAGGLFPVPLGAAPRLLEHSVAATEPDLLMEDHPVFRILSGTENPFIDAVRVNYYYPIDAERWEASRGQSPQTRVIARLRNREPVIYESTCGDGRVVTFLTSAGPLRAPDGLIWNNWAGGPAAPSFAVMILELQKFVARRDRSQPRRTVGEPIEEQLDRNRFLEDVVIVTPGEESLTVRAIWPESLADSPEGSEPTDSAQPWSATFRETDQPGIYVVRRFDPTNQPVETWIAYNFPEAESHVQVASAEDVSRQIGDAAGVTMQDADALDLLRNEPPGQDVRWWLLALLLALLVGEQAMAYRLSYH
jgi:hypothetical protein